MPFFNLPDSGAGGGSTLLSGAGAPSSSIGADGAFYLDTSARVLYGPKAGSSWGTGIALTGAQWDEITNKPATFPPSAHTHSIADVTSLQTSLDGKASTTHSHSIAEVTGLQTALDGKQPTGTYATLVGGIVPTSQLPSFVDDVVEVSSLPGTGEAGKIYVNTTTGKVFRWGGSAFVEIAGSPGSTDAVPEGSTNRYFTNARAVDALSSSLASKANLSHTHAISDTTGLQTALDGKQVAGSYAAASHTHTASQITDFNAAVVAASPPTTNASLLTSGTVASERLPLATTTTAGALVVGSGLSVSSGIVSANVTSINGITGALTLAPGPNVTITSANSTLTIAASGGLGENDAVDGGNYVGEILGGITFSVQPQSQTASTSYSFGNWAASQATFSPDANNSKIQPVGGVVSLGSTLYTIAYGSDSQTRLYKSANSGSSWSVAAQETKVGRFITPTAEATQLAGNGTSALIAISEGPLYLTTNAGQNWSAAADYTGGPSRKYMTYGAGLWVMIMPGATGYAGTSTSSDGTNWTDRTIPAGLYSGVAFGNGLFVAPRGTHAAISSDGITWSSVSLPSIGSGQSTGGIAFGNGMFVVSASSEDGSVIRIFRSTDGSTWTSHAVSFVSAAITYATGLFAATTSTSSTDVWTSGNGTSWTLGVLPASDAWKPVAALSSTLFTTRSVATSGDDYILRLASASVTAVNGSASFTATASVSSGQTISYQWQLSTDAGSNWTNISGATTSTLSLSGLTTADSGKRYRVSASATGATTVTSQSATLTVTG
jgi:hypothetical protein